MPLKSRRGCGSPGTRVIDSCESPRGCWESNLCPMEEQPMLLTTESSLQPLLRFFEPQFSSLLNKNNILPQGLL